MVERNLHFSVSAPWLFAVGDQLRYCTSAFKQFFTTCCLHHVPTHLRHNDSAGSHLQHRLRSTGSECRGKYLSFFKQYFKILRVKRRTPCGLFCHRFVSIGKCVLCWYQRGGEEIGGYGTVFLKYRIKYLIKSPVVDLPFYFVFDAG